METTDFEDVLREAAEETTTLQPDNLDPAEFKALRRFGRKRLEWCWEFHFWPFLGRVEQRFYRPDWNSATTYAATNEVYYPPTGKYYQALQASTNQAPADSSGATQTTYWEESSRSYQADTFSATASYSKGNRVSYADQVYQVFVAGPITGVLPTDNTQWALLTNFDQYVLYGQPGKTAIGIVAAAWNLNPRTTTRGIELNWNLSDVGVQISSPNAFAWLDYRIRCPKLTGDMFDTTATYASGDQVYFSSASTPGNFYTANTATAAGESPDSQPAKWDVIQIPRNFHKPLVHGIAADWIKGPGGGSPEDLAEQLALAQAALDDQKSLYVGQQSQRIKTVVRTR